MRRGSFVIRIQPNHKYRTDYFKHRNISTKIYKAKKHNNKKSKQEFKKFLREEYGL